MVYLMFDTQINPRETPESSSFLLLHLYYTKNIFVAWSYHSAKSYLLAGQIILLERGKEKKYFLCYALLISPKLGCGG